MAGEQFRVITYKPSSTIPGSKVVNTDYGYRTLDSALKKYLSMCKEGSQPVLMYKKPGGYHELHTWGVFDHEKIMSLFKGGEENG